MKQRWREKTPASNSTEKDLSMPNLATWNYAIADEGAAGFGQQQGSPHAESRATVPPIPLTQPLNQP